MVGGPHLLEVISVLDSADGVVLAAGGVVGVCDEQSLLASDRLQPTTADHADLISSRYAVTNTYSSCRHVTIVYCSMERRW